MLGIGLGAFTQGFVQGINIGAQVRELRKQRSLENDVEGITKSGKAAFDKDVAAGKEDKGDFMSYYAQNMVPQVAERYLRDGDPAKAQAWMDWSTSASAKNGTKKFLSGLSKFNSGDVENGVQDMIKAAHVAGYGPDGKATAAEYYDEEQGRVTGYRLSFTGSDGKEQTKNVAVEDIPTFFSNLMNPQAAFEMEQATKAAHTKADLEVDTYGRKKQLDKQLGTGTGALTAAQYQNAIQEERKAMENSIDPETSDMTSDEKEAKAKEIVDARYAGMGQTADPAAQIAIDPTTGEQIDVTGGATAAVDPAAAPPDEQLGIAAPPTAEEAPPEAAPQPQPAQPNAPADPAAASSPAAATSTVDPGQAEQYLSQASQMIRQGMDPQKIGRALIAAGLPPESWPQDVQQAAQRSQLGIAP